MSILIDKSTRVITQGITGAAGTLHTDKSAEYSDVLLTSVMFDYTGVYEQLILNAGTDQFGQVYTMNVSNGGVRLLDLPESVPADVREAVETAEAAIVAGDITVSAIGPAEEMHARLAELGYE